MSLPKKEIEEICKLDNTVIKKENEINENIPIIQTNQVTQQNSFLLKEIIGNLSEKCSSNLRKLELDFARTEEKLKQEEINNDQSQNESLGPRSKSKKISPMKKKPGPKGPNYSQETRRQALDAIKSGATMKKVAEDLNCSIGSIKRWKKQGASKAIRHRPKRCKILETYLYDWIIEQVKYNQEFNLRKITQQALQWNDDPYFVASISWLQGYIDRFGLSQILSRYQFRL